MKKLLTKDKRELIDAKVRQVVASNLALGMQPTKQEIERIRIEATEMVEKEQLTWADMRPAQYDITESMSRRYDAYVSPRDLK